MKILCINGSGTGGYRAITYLCKLEKELDKPLHETFDLIVGVSSGAIIGAFIASGSTAAEGLDIFKEFIPSVFSNPRGLLRHLFTTKYKGSNLSPVIKDTFKIQL